MLGLTGKTALVTGATSGIGKATAIALAATGATVAVSGRDKERGDDVVDAIRAAGGSAVFVAADLVDAEAAVDLAARATAALGGGGGGGGGVGRPPAQDHVGPGVECGQERLGTHDPVMRVLRRTAASS